MEFELGIQLIYVSSAAFRVNIIGNIYLNTADLDTGGILLKITGTWNTVNLLIDCIPNSNSTDKTRTLNYSKLATHLRNQLLTKRSCDRNPASATSTG